MLMKQKTVRFYEESKADMEAYEKLECFREYGFSNARELIIAAVNAYSQRENDSSGINIDVDRLASLIADKLNCGEIHIEKESQIVLENEDESNSEVFEKALSFIEGL